MPQLELGPNQSASRHRLGPLLAPRSVALVGASPRADTIGNQMIDVLHRGGYGGAISLVNPKYEEIGGLACRPSLPALGDAPDLAVLALSGTRLEAALDEAIAVGAGSALIFDSCYEETERSPSLLQTLRAKAKSAGLPVLGGNAMGYYNFDAATHVCFQPAPDRPAGAVTLIAHSGSVFVACVANDPRHRFNLVVSAGQEIGTSLADYMDYALEQPSTKVIALFMETLRDPAGFIAALEKAKARAIPVVAVKVGHSPAAARFAASHSGAIAGNDAAYEALFDHYGVVRVETLDDLLASAQLLTLSGRTGPGALGYLGDSGGLRELLTDRADTKAVPLARFSANTRSAIAKHLPRGLEPDNPLDAAGPITADFAQAFSDCLPLVLDDPDVAVATFEFEARDDFVYMPAFVEIAKKAPRLSRKPFFVLNSLAGAQNGALAEDLEAAGVPLINGLDHALAAVRGLLAYRDFRARPANPPPSPPAAGVLDRWRARLAEAAPLPEQEGLALLSDFGVAAVTTRSAASEENLIAAARALTFPLALKTAEPGILHKTDAGGVVLNLSGEEALRQAYRDMAGRLGPRVLLAPMIPAGVELAFGLIRDPQFGPLVMVGAGGTLVELLADRRLALPPFGTATARRLIERLKAYPLLCGHRGTAAADLAGLAEALARFSVLADCLGPQIAELDVNPVIASGAGPMAVDALVVPVFGKEQSG